MLILVICDDKIASDRLDTEDAPLLFFNNEHRRHFVVSHLTSIILSLPFAINTFNKELSSSFSITAIPTMSCTSISNASASSALSTSSCDIHDFDEQKMPLVFVWYHEQSWIFNSRNFPLRHNIEYHASRGFRCFVIFYIRNSAYMKGENVASRRDDMFRSSVFFYTNFSITKNFLS